MKLPGGGEGEGSTAAMMLACEVRGAAPGIVCCMAASTGVPRYGAVIAAGGVRGLAVQQVDLSGIPGMLMCEQQLCVAACAGNTHVPTDNSKTLIMTMATAVRWLKVRNMMTA